MTQQKKCVMFHYRTWWNSLNAKNPVSGGSSLLFSGRDISTSWRLLETIIKVKVWVATGDVAQDHEEGISSELPGLDREALGPPLFMHLQLVEQLVEEDPQLDTRDLLLVG